jgi:hypothetical protein
MQFSVMVTRVAEETGLNATNDATKIKAWLNEAYRFLAGLREWPWMLKNGTVQTVADITTLTASVNAAGTAVTLSAGPAQSLANDYMIQFATTDDWYLVTAHTAAATAVTISPGYVGAANLTAGACTIRKVYYSLASDADRIIDMYEAIDDRKLYYIDPRELDASFPDPTVTGTPEAYTLLGFDSTNYWRTSFIPIPGVKQNIQYRYYKAVADLSGDTDLPTLPAKWHQGIVFVALAMFGHPYMDDSRMSSAESRARQLVSEMVRQQSPTPDKHSVIMPWDRRSGLIPHGAQFPPDFPQR